jgi:hypothetical protein
VTGWDGVINDLRWAPDKGGGNADVGADKGVGGARADVPHGICQGPKT